MWLKAACPVYSNQNDVIKSENAKDWLIQCTAAQISKQCEAE